MTSQLLVVCDTDFYLYLFFYPASSLPQFVFTCQGQWLHLSAAYIVYMVISSWINKWMYDKPCNRCYCSLRLIKKKKGHQIWFGGFQYTMAICPSKVYVWGTLPCHRYPVDLPLWRSVNNPATKHYTEMLISCCLCANEYNVRPLKEVYFLVSTQDKHTAS